VRVLQKLPDGPELAAERREAAESRLGDSSLSASDCESLRALVKLAEKTGAPKR
jgi:hypothetical protein